MTHEEFIAAVREFAVVRVREGADRARLLDAKLVYGAGLPRTRGSCYFGRWDSVGRNDLIEICALGEESVLQLAGTTLHELAHVLAGHAAGHGPRWKAAARILGLVRSDAAGQIYVQAHFAPELRTRISKLPPPDDGNPVPFEPRTTGGFVRSRLQPCPLGIGTKGGRSRGTGSGSRLRLWVCACNPPVRVRVARDAFRAVCQDCGNAFKRDRL